MPAKDSSEEMSSSGSESEEDCPKSSFNLGFGVWVLDLGFLGLGFGA